jgi:hypothetical protein
MATPAVQALRTYLQANTDKKGTPLYDAALNKLKSLVGVSDPAGDQAREIASRPKASFMDVWNATVPGRILQGTADLPIGAAQFVANATGVGDDTMNKFVDLREESLSRGRQAIGSEGYDWARLGGNLATGAAAASKAAIPKALGEKVVQGSLMGLGVGAATPTDSEDYWSDKTAQMGIGALTGAVVPAAIGGATWAGGKVADLANLVHPMGVQGNARRAVLAAAGDKADDIIANLDNNVNPVSQGSVAEVASPAGSAEFTGLMRAAENRNPSRALAASRAADAARIEAIRSAGGSPDDLVNAMAFRSGNAAPLYHAAYEQGFDDVAAKGIFGEPTSVAASRSLDDMLGDPIIQKVMPEVEMIAGSENVERGTVYYYHLVKKALDGYLSKNTGESGLTPSVRAATENVRKEFIRKLGDAAPLYDAARKQFAYDSDVINRMQVAQYIENKLVPALADFGADAPLRSSTFAQATRDAPRTIRNATGNTIHDSLGSVFANDITALGRINAVGDDLARSANTERLVRAGAQRGAEIVSDIGKLPQAHVLERSFVIVNGVLSRLGKKSQEATLDYLETISRDPVKFAAMMRGSTPAQRAAINEIMVFAQIAPPIAATQEAD